MKAAQILVGGHYLAKVSGRIVPLRVLAAGNAQTGPAGCRPRIVWTCLNTVTGREIVVRSPQRFRAAVQERTP